MAGKPVQILLAVLVLAATSSFFLTPPVVASEQFNDLQCQIDFADKDICNIAFFRKFLSVRLLKSGVAQRFRLDNLIRWSYENASLRKRASLLSTRVEHIHVFTLVFNDAELGGYQTVVVDFDDISNVPPMKALLNELAPQS